jgi:hypothetical protein
MRQNILIRTPGGIRRAGALVLGEGLRITETAGGLPELESTIVGDPPLMPSGGDDTQAIQNALGTGRDVRLGPGDFHISYPLTVGANGKGQRLSGSGTGRTFLHFHYRTGPLIHVRSGGESGENGLYIENGSRVVAESVFVLECTRYGVRLSGGTGHRLSTIHADNCSTGIALDGNVGAVTGESLTLADCFRNGIVVDHARDVSLNGCRALNTNGPLSILDSQNVVASAFASESTRAWSPLHVRVERSPGVFFTSTRVVNGTTPPTYEVDVSQGGSPVLFGPNNFDMTRINSGGNFARVCHS